MYQAKVIADSESVIDGSRLTTFEVTYPRSIHAEMCRHRNQSRNSASSRAIPVNRMVDNALNDTFLPIYLGKNKAGMSADEEVDEETQDLILATIAEMAEWNADKVLYLASLGLHKQTANRYIEPYIYHTEIISATDWSNFYALRISPYAQPEIQKIAMMMNEAQEASKPEKLNWRDWHLPYVTKEDLDRIGLEDAKKVSLARCSRVSFNRQNTVKELPEDIAQYDRLVTNGHWSCAEHPATPRPGRHGNYNGWLQLRKFFPNEDDFSKVEQ